MKTILLIIITAVAAAAFTACGGAANTAPANTAPPATPAPKGPPTKEALVGLEKAAFDAWTKKDGAHFKELLDENFIMLAGGQRLSKEATIKEITDNKCIAGEFKFADERMTLAGNDAAVLTAKVTSDVTCDGKKQPGNAVIASVYVRKGNEWKAVFHNEMPIAVKTETAAPAPANAAPAAKSGDDSEKAAANPSGVDAQTAPLLDLHKAGAEAWKARDAKKLADMTGADLVFVDPMGSIHGSKADVIKAWTEPKCDVASVNLSDATGIPVSNDASMLLSKLTAVGICDGQKLGPVWGMAMYVKQGEAWKMVYLMEWPA